MIFTMAFREDHPQKKVSMSDLGGLWKELTTSEKSIYQQKASEMKLEYIKSMKEYLA